MDPEAVAAYHPLPDDENDGIDRFCPAPACLDLPWGHWYGHTMAELINANGNITPADRAVVPVLDHGFLYGDSVYETIRTYRGVPFLLTRHLERLKNSCLMIRLTPPSIAEIEREVRRTTSEAGNGESYIRIMITRGVGPIG